MVTTKENIISRIGRARQHGALFKRELAQQIPDLWKYANTLQADKDKAYELLGRTISKAKEMHAKSALLQANYQILSRIMYREYIGRYDAQSVSDLYEFTAPISAGFVQLRPAAHLQAHSTH